MFKHRKLKNGFRKLVNRYHKLINRCLGSHLSTYPSYNHTSNTHRISLFKPNWIKLLSTMMNRYRYPIRENNRLPYLLILFIHWIPLICSWPQLNVIKKILSSSLFMILIGLIRVTSIEWMSYWGNSSLNYITKKYFKIYSIV